jgi:hypothetical protein
LVEIKFGEWKIVNLDGQAVTRMKCPGCEQWQYLEDHSIDEHGQVVPSVECGEDCGFHDVVRLLNYPHGAKERKEASGEKV